MGVHLIDSEQFESQLDLVAAKVEDPRVGLYGPDSVMWKIGKHFLLGMHGSGRALLLQIAHPWVTRGINEHSQTREDPLGRAARTFTSVFSIVYGSLEQATRQARLVHKVHLGIYGKVGKDSGAFVEGSHYQANEAHAMLWVHATLWETLALMYETFVGPLSREEKERYYEETRLFAYMFGIPDAILPPNWWEFLEYNQQMHNSDKLAINEDALELAGFLFKPMSPALAPAMSWLKLVTAATVPDRLRRDFHLAFDSRQRRRFALGVKAVHTFDRYAPRIAAYGPTYLEAQRRIQGKPALWITRELNKRLYGRSELVA